MFEERQTIDIRWQRVDGKPISAAFHGDLSRHAFERIFNMRSEGYVEGELFHVPEDGNPCRGYWTLKELRHF